MFFQNKKVNLISERLKFERIRQKQETLRQDIPQFLVLEIEDDLNNLAGIAEVNDFVAQTRENLTGKTENEISSGVHKLLCELIGIFGRQ